MGRRVIAGSAVIAVALAFAGCTDHDQPTSPTPMPTVTSDAGLPDAAPPLSLEDLENFSGIATMNAGGNCTGTLIDTGVPTGPAYVLTNGHCIGDIGRSRQGTTLDEEWWGTAEFFRAAGNLENTYTAHVVQIAYSTMRYTDTGIVRLDATLAEVQAHGVTALPIADSEPAGGASVVNVGVPVQGLYETDWVMRKSTCTLGDQVTVIEFGWLWRGVWTNDCEGIIQGSSGSPLLEVDADGVPQRVVAMINTTSWGTSQAQGGACFINRPCQVAADGTATMVERTSYAQSVAGVGTCFSATTGEFELTADCPLPVSTVWAEDGGGSFRGGTLPDSADRVPWASFVGAHAGTFRQALVPIGDTTACADPATYADAEVQPLPLAGEIWDHRGTRVEPVLPTQEGWYLMCAVRGDDYPGSASVLFEVDTTPPIYPAGAELERQPDGAVFVQPHMNPPEIMTSKFLYGPEGTVDCEDTSKFESPLLHFTFIEPADLPAVYCIVGLDAAGNETPVTKIEIPAP